MDRPDFGYLYRTVLEAAYRHSRVSGNPDGTEKASPLPPNRRQIPAYAGMTVGAGGNGIKGGGGTVSISHRRELALLPP